jgi:hypothetical protein
MMPKGEDGIKFVFIQESLLSGLFRLRRGQRMKSFRRILVLTFIIELMMLEANVLIAQTSFSVLNGKVVGISRMWLNVESDKDKAIVNFRIGHKTVYIPHRYPNPGEKVKVEYLTPQGTPVAYTVTILEGSK